MAGDVDANCREQEKAGVASLKALPPSSGRFAKKDILSDCCEEGLWMLAAVQLADNAAAVE